jgi:hypothetical protein
MNSDATCFHCGSSFSATSLAEGWCESCGKRVPSSAVPKAPAATPSPVEDRTTGSHLKGTLIWLGATAALISLSLVVFFHTVRIGAHPAPANPQQLTATR